MQQIDTKQLAQMMGVTQPYVRWRLAVTGSFYGMVPVKLPNGKNAWDKAEAEAKAAAKATLYGKDAIKPAEQCDGIG